MAFTGQTFIFDGISSEYFGLILCDFNGAKQEAGRVGEERKVHEERLARRHSGLHYGVSDNTPKSFPLVMVAAEDNHHFNRDDVAQIAYWLSGHDDYKELHISEPHMEQVYYRCIITDIEQIEVGMHIVGFTATAHCDSPYAYRRMGVTTLTSEESTTAVYCNMSNIRDYYYPKMEVACSGSGLAIENTTDGTAFILAGMPAGERTIYIDCLNQVMTSSDGIDLYQYWDTRSGAYFPRFVCGHNDLMITGNCVVTIQNEIPWKIGN